MLYYLEVLALFKHLLAQLTVIVLIKHDSFDSSLDNHLCAKEAGEACRIDGAAHGLRATSFQDS